MTWRLNTRKKLILFFVLLLISLLYYITSRYVLYCNDAYVLSDLIKITPEVPGIIHALYAKDNQFVKKNTLLLEIVSTPYQLTMQQKQAALLRAKEEEQLLILKQQETKALLDEANTKYNLSNATLKRYESLKQDHIKAISAELFDRILSHQKVAIANQMRLKIVLQEVQQALLIQKAKIKMAENEFGIAQYNLSLTKIYSPVSGFINNLRVYAGDYAKPGVALFGLVAAEPWYIIANYKEYAVSHIRPGQTALVYIFGYGPHVFRGTVESVAYAVAREPFVNNAALPYIKPVTDWIRYPYRFPVRIRLDHVSSDIRLHMGADVRTVVLS